MQVGLRDRGEDPTAEGGGFQQATSVRLKACRTWTEVSAKPIRSRASPYSSAGGVPPISPSRVASASRIDAGSGRRVARSVMASRPPGLRTRQASVSTRSLAGDRLMAQLEITTSALASSTGRASILPRRNSRLVRPASAACRVAKLIISGVRSTPMTRPDGPTRRAHARASTPPPEPRSTTVDPAGSSTSTARLAQPSDAASAPTGRSSWPYRAVAIGCGSRVVLVLAAAP